ncbi:hypothetical protein ACFQY0_20290 [Haloferula chungangensis]|uniref:Uncharacterized protein n=2 Tax=Haloferula chungangensis TaxID=1048331 RepID=A0ABW2LEX2_9BACT
MNAPECFQKAANWQKAATSLFWLNAGLSFALIFAKNSNYEAILSIPLCALVAGSLMVSVRSRCLINDGNGAQRAVQIADALGVACEHPVRNGYYNSSRSPGLPRLFAITCESAGLTKEILQEMLTRHILKLSAYILIFLIYLGYAKADVSILAVIAQTVFSGDLIGGLVNLLRYLHKVQKTEQALIQFFRTSSDINDPHALAIGLAAHTDYECAKEESAVLLDSKIYDKRNSGYTERWNRLRSEFKIDS